MASFSTTSSDAVYTHNASKYSTKSHEDPHYRQKKGVTISPSENPSTPEFAYELLEAELRLETNEDVDQKLVMKLF